MKCLTPFAETMTFGWASAKSTGKNLHVVMGTLKEARRKQIFAATADTNAPASTLFPSQINVFIAAANDPETGFGKGIPLRIEHRRAPDSTSPQGRGKVDFAARILFDSTHFAAVADSTLSFRKPRTRQ